MSAQKEGAESPGQASEQAAEGDDGDAELLAEQTSTPMTGPFLPWAPPPSKHQPAGVPTSVWHMAGPPGGTVTRQTQPRPVMVGWNGPALALEHRSWNFGQQHGSHAQGQRPLPLPGMGAVGESQAASQPAPHNRPPGDGQDGVAVRPRPPAPAPQPALRAPTGFALSRPGATAAPVRAPAARPPPPPGLTFRPAPPPPPPRRDYEEPLDPRFSLVEKPRRFFTVGRIFKTVWFEPGGTEPEGLGPVSLEYSRVCPGFYSEKPHARFRWFVVCRKRLHHSLCFPITVFSGAVPPRPNGRGRDSVLLYPAPACGRVNANLDNAAADAASPSTLAPTTPAAGEAAEREGLGIVIEDGAQTMSRRARLDCARIYTVEDSVKVMKLGRVHPDWLPLLEDYYREAVN